MNSKPYSAQFEEGAMVKVRSKADLERFQAEWQYHNPITAEQIEYADRTARIAEIGYYHGGEPLYRLEGLPGVWHEPCLAPT